MTQPVGVVGLGLLGSALAERLLAADFNVIGYDVDAGCRERFAAIGGGGAVASDLASVAGQCGRIVLSLPESSVSAEVTGTLKPHLLPGAIIIDTTTGHPDEMVAIGDELAAAAGVGYLDATIAGSSVQTRNGEVLVLIGGDEEHVAACRDLIAAISAQSLHVGPRGSGSRMKLVVNLVLGLNRAVLAEGLTFAKSLGVDPAKALDVLSQSPAASSVMQSKGEKMVTGDYTPQARLRQHLKDVRLILDVAGEAKTPLSELHADLLQSLVDGGFGDEDNSAVMRAFE